MRLETGYCSGTDSNLRMYISAFSIDDGMRQRIEILGLPFSVAVSISPSCQESRGFIVQSYLRK